MAYEDHGGATAALRFAAPLGGAIPNAPPRGRIASDLRPRFVRGNTGALIVSEDHERATYVEIRSPGARRQLCACLDAVAVSTARGLAVVSKVLRPGAMVGGVPAGALMLEWPIGAHTLPLPLFGARDVFDYDATGVENDVVIAAVTREGPAVVIVATNGSVRDVAVEGLPHGLEPFSPALHAIARSATLALLARAAPSSGGPTLLFVGTISL